MFIRCYRRCCICSANYCKFCLISLLVLLVDVRALFLVMWPLSWYQFCVSLPLEVRTIGLVLFLQVLTLCFTLLAASRSCWPCVQWQRFQCSRASQQQWTIWHRKERVVCYLCRPSAPLRSTWPSVSGNRCDTSPLPLPAADRTYITSRHCEKRAQKLSHADREEEGTMNRGRSKWSSVFVIDFHRILPALPSDSPACRARL